jgi:hypothetical protein
MCPKRLSIAALALLVSSPKPVHAVSAGPCGGLVDCPQAALPFGQGFAQTETAPHRLWLGTSTGSDACLATSGRVLGAVVIHTPPLTNLTLVTDVPAIDVVAGGSLSTFPVVGTTVHCAGADCKVADGLVLVNAFAVTESHINVVVGGERGEFPLPEGARPVSAAGTGACSGDSVSFSLCVETTAPSIECVLGGEQASFAIPAPTVATPLSWSNGAQAGVVVFTAREVMVISGGAIHLIPLPDDFAGYVVQPDGVLVLTGAGNVFVPLAAGVTVVPFGDCSQPLSGCGGPPSAIAFNVLPCFPSIDAANAVWPPSGIRCRQYRALLIANDEFRDANDELETALRNWNSWERGRITKLDDLSGRAVLAAIRSWASNVRPGDVALFSFCGRGGITRDDEDDDDDERRSDPVLENDRNADDAGRVRRVDGTLGLGRDPKDTLHATDDEVMEALAELPDLSTKVAVFDTCYANEHCGGLRDSDQVSGIVVLNATPEAPAAPGTAGGTWTTALSRVLFDLDGDGAAQADFNRDSQVTVAEWFAAAAAAAGAGAILCRGASEPVLVAMNTRQRPRPPAAAGVGQGFDGSGVCSEPDFGDAPDNGMLCAGPTGVSPRNYGTTRATNGPLYHEWTLQWLGPSGDGRPLTDGEADGQPSCGADGDGADEDGVVFGPDFVRVTVTVDHPEPLNYRLDAWWDLNDNGVFNQPAEHVISSGMDYDGFSGGRLLDLAGEAESTEFFYQLGFDPRGFYSRFRLTFGVVAGPIMPVGAFLAADGAAHGEVEDYAPTARAGVAMVRADANTDGQFDISDAVFNLNYLFSGTSSPNCLDAADADDNGRIDLTDAIRILNVLFLGTGSLVQPFPECGLDPTEDDLGCSSFPPCGS